MDPKDTKTTSDAEKDLSSEKKVHIYTAEEMDKMDTEMFCRAVKAAKKYKEQLTKAKK